MIKLKQVKTELNKVILVFEADFPDGTIKTVEIDGAEIEERLKHVRNLLGRLLTLQDLKDVIKTIFKELREGKKPLTEKFDYSQFIDVDLEAEG